MKGLFFYNFIKKMALSLPMEKLKIKIMKKTTNIFIILAVAMMALVSCEKEDPSYPEDLTTKQVFNFTVKANDWDEVTDNDGLNRYYRYGFKLRDLKPNASLEKCAVLAYVNYGNYEAPLPYTRHYEDLDFNFWTRTIDFDYSLNDVNFYVTNSDFAKDRPERMYFRVVFIW